MVKKPDKMMTTTIDNITALSNPILYVPKIMFLTKGKGLHKDYLTSFELALKIIHKTLNTGNKRIKYICVGILDTLFR
jgi:hypothetical protein